MSTLHRGSMKVDSRCIMAMMAMMRAGVNAHGLTSASRSVVCSCARPSSDAALCQEPPCLWYMFVRVVLFAKSHLAYGYSLFMLIGDSLLWCFLAWSISPRSFLGHSLLAPTPSLFLSLPPPLFLFLSRSPFGC